MPSDKKSSNESSLEEKFRLVANTIRAYPAQLKQAWEEIESLTIPNDYKNVENIVFCGMGGSALGARMVDSYAFNKLRVPLEIFNDYKIPNYVDNKTLLILSSYSGTTEETIESTHQAILKGAKIFGITTDGKLAEILNKENLPGYIFEPRANPSGQPRMAIGYASGAFLALLAKLGVISLASEELDQAVTSMNEVLTEYHEAAASEKNLALSFAKKLRGRIPILVASEHLVGTAHTIKNQFNESAKTFCALFDIPELNHHLMEGLANPPKLRELFTFVFISSRIYSEKNQKRYPLTADVVEKNGVSHLVYSPRSQDKLSQVYETLVFGSYVVFYLTKILKIDPMQIPWVDYFKEKLAKI